MWKTSIIASQDQARLIDFYLLFCKYLPVAINQQSSAVVEAMQILPLREVDHYSAPRSENFNGKGDFDDWISHYESVQQ